MSGVNFDSSYQSMITDATTQLKGATNDCCALLEQLKGMKFSGPDNKPIGPFNSLAEYQKALSQPGVKCDSSPGNDALAATLGKINDALGKLDSCTKLIESLKAGMSEQMTSMKAMLALLQSGDIEGAVMMLQTSRAKVLEAQLGTRIEGMQVRNAQIKNLNDQLKVQQNALANVDSKDQAGRDRINATITGIKGDMDKLNSDSQLDMIGIQGLVNKRNEAFDMLTNLLG